MTNDEQEPFVPAPQKKSWIPYGIMGGLVFVVVAVFIVGVQMRGEPQRAVEQPPAEYVVAEKMYQLKDGAYLRLGFSIVVAAQHCDVVKHIVEKESPGRLPDGINSLCGEKTREDLISGVDNRREFAREVKRVLEERVFAGYNRRQLSAKDAIDVEEVLISSFVTQGG